MSRRHQHTKRRRYYRRHPEILDTFAGRLGLDFCEYTGDCDFCDEEKRDPLARNWVSLCRGQDFTETDFCICADCLPDYYRDAMARANSTSIRAAWRYCRHLEMYSHWK